MKRLILRPNRLRCLIFCAFLSIISYYSTAQTGGAIYTVGPEMPRANVYPTSVLLSNGKIISFGGREYNFISGRHAEIFDPISNSFMEQSMNFPHDAAATIKLTDGRYFILGGSADTGVAPGNFSTEMYNPKTNTFISMAPMKFARLQLAGAQLSNGKILIAGTWKNQRGARVGEIYDTTSNTFLTTGPLEQARAYPIVLPTRDGGAVVAGGWPTNGGLTFKSYEYYRTATNKFDTLFEELISDDHGWMLNPIYTRPISDSRVNDGNYLLLAHRNIPSLEYALIVFNPFSKKFSKLKTDSTLMDAYSDGGFIDLVLNKANNLVFLMGTDSAHDPQRLCLVTVNLSNGKVYHPGNTFNLPVHEYLFPTMTFISSNGKILVQGINSSNSAYAQTTKKTYLLTPIYDQEDESMDTSGKSQIKCTPNPVSVVLNIDLNSFKTEQYNVILLDNFGKVWINEKRNRITDEKDRITYDVQLFNEGIYRLLIFDQSQFVSKKIIISR